MAKKKERAKDRREQALKARIDAANEREMARQIKEYGEKGMQESPATESGDGRGVPMPETAPKETPAETAVQKPAKAQRRPSKLNLLKPGTPMEREDGRQVCPVPVSVRMTLEELMKTVRKEDPDGSGRVLIRTDGEECLGHAPHMVYAYVRGLYTRLDPSTSRNRSAYILADMLSRPVRGILCEQKENGTDWYITLSPAAGTAAENA